MVKDIAKETMDRSLYDAAGLVYSFNRSVAGEFGEEYKIPPSAIPEIALNLYQVRVMNGIMPNTVASPNRMFD